MKVLICVLLIMFIQGCANTQGIASKEVPVDGKILVVSKMGDDFSVQKVGLTVFNNSKFKVDVSSWAIDDFIQEQVKSKLSDFYSVEFNSDLSHRVSHPEDNFFTGYPYPLKQANGLLDMQKEGYEYLLLITPVKIQDIYFQTNQYVEGYGIYERSLFGNTNSLTYAQVSFSLFELSSGSFIATNGDVKANKGDSVWVNHVVNPGKTGILKNTDSSETVESYRLDIEDLIAEVVERSINYMGFKQREQISNF